MERRSQYKTYSHLAPSGRMPGEYDLVTSKLLYYPERGFEVRTPVTRWYEKYQKASALKLEDWDTFRDPRETTYTRYTAARKEQEQFVDGLLNSMSSNYEDKLAKEWLGEVARTFSVLRYPYHALQMAAAYLGQLSPSGRLVILFMLQSSDEMRKIQRFAYRLAQLRAREPEAPTRGLKDWESEPRWQGLRELMERLLTTYDWSEGWVALNLCVKPALDDLFLNRFGSRALSRGDYLLAEILRSLDADSSWQREWSSLLRGQFEAHSQENGARITEWYETWTEKTRLALAPLAEVLHD